MTFTNGCVVRMFLATRYSDAPDLTARRHLLAAGETVTIVLGRSQTNQAFRARYEGRFASGSDVRDERATRTVQAPAPHGSTGPRVEERSHSETLARRVASPEPSGGDLSLVELCRRAMRKIVRLEEAPENDGANLDDLVAACPERVSRDPEKRRAELECVLKTSARGDVGSCFGTN